jgi:ABC-type polysaccharide/polyol phosphate export permease
MNFLKSIFQRRELWWNLTTRELKQRYKGSLLGFLWSVLTPLFMAFIYVFFLRMLAGRGISMEEIIIGVFAWQFTTQSVSGGMTCVTGNGNLVKKVFFPREILPLALVTANTISYLLSLLIQFPILAFLLSHRGAHFSAWAPLTLFWILWQTLLNLGLAMITGAANTYFRDTQHLVGVLLSAWFFLSPVMYSIEFAQRIAAQWPMAASLLMVNPMAVILTGYRAAILPNATLSFTPSVWAGFLVTPVLCLAGIWMYQKLQKNFADFL